VLGQRRTAEDIAPGFFDCSEKLGVNEHELLGRPVPGREVEQHAAWRVTGEHGIERRA